MFTQPLQIMVHNLSHLKGCNSPQLWSALLIGASLLTAVPLPSVAAGQPGTALQTAQSLQAQNSAPATPLPRPIVRRVRRHLAQEFNVPRKDLRVVQFSRETWSDSCLGLAAPNERCATSIVEGWRVEMTNGQQNWVYRTDSTAQVLRPEMPNNATELPPDITDRLFQTIAQETGVPANTLKVAAVKQTTWDGCMGIFVPGRLCTQIATPGWQVIVAGDQQSWVYHVSEDGSRIVQNQTASGAQGDLIPSFIEDEPFPLNHWTATLVFRWIESGGLAGQVTEKFLMSDGVIYRREWRMSSEPTAEPVVENRITPEQVAQFQQLLIEQQFSNLRGLKYISSVSLADYPTITLQGLGNTVQLTDLELKNFPKALQTVFQAWEQLASPDR